MLRIRLSSKDVESIRISVSPAFQTITAALTASLAEAPAIHAAHARLVRDSGWRGAPLANLLELDGMHLPDFLTPAPTSEEMSIDEELDLAASTPAWRRARDARHLEQFIGFSAAADALVAGDTDAGNRVLEGVRAFHRAAYGGAWTHVRGRLRIEADRRRRELDTRGVDHVLATIHPSVSWRPPVLTISDNSYDGNYERHGQGIVLVPSVGRLRTVTTMVNPWEPITIGYPVLAGPQTFLPNVMVSAKLIRLIGNTKARVLVAVASRPDLTTTQLADHLDISVASVSEHASILRSAGLIASSRDRNAVRHTLLPLGSELIRSSRI